MLKCEHNYATFNKHIDSVKDYLAWWKNHKINLSTLSTWSIETLLENEKNNNYYEANLQKYYELVKYQLDGLITNDVIDGKY